MRERERKEMRKFGSFWKRPEFDTSSFIGPLIELFKYWVCLSGYNQAQIKNLELRAKNWAMGKLQKCGTVAQSFHRVCVFISLYWSSVFCFDKLYFTVCDCVVNLCS